MVVLLVLGYALHKDYIYDISYIKFYQLSTW